MAATTPQAIDTLLDEFEGLLSPVADDDMPGFPAGGRQDSMSDLLEMIGHVSPGAHSFPEKNFGDADVAIDLIRQSCRAEGTSFCDPDFPASAQSLYLSGNGRTFTWLRPHEFCQDSSTPVLFASGYPRAEDVKQGSIGDCFFMSAVSVVANVFPEKLHALFLVKEVNREGVYAFNFYKDSAWQTVIIDDRIPCKSGVPVYGKSKNGAELWVILLEKAYAKLYGSYEAIKGGNTSEALVDITGAAVTDIKLNSDAAQAEARSGMLFKRLSAQHKSGSALACGFIDTARKGEQATKKGIIKNHAYGVLNMYTVAGTRVLRIYNPWGTKQWTGTETFITPAIKRAIEADKCAGSFFMKFEDFVQAFNRVYVCSVGVGTMTERIQTDCWRGDTAGGCSNFSSWRQNPMFVVSARGKARIVVTLSQPDKRGTTDQLDYNQIGLTIIRLPKEDGHVTPCVVQGVYTEVEKSTFWNKREVTTELLFKSEKYVHVIVPSTYYPKQEGDFTLLARSTDDSLSLERLTWPHHTCRVQGEWTGKSRGGPPRESTFRHNPQYKLTLSAPSRVSIMCAQGGEAPYIGAGIYVLPFEGGRFGAKSLPSSQCIGETFKFTNTPEVYRSLLLEEGDYLLMPCTFKPKQSRTFTLSVFALTPIDLEEASGVARERPASELSTGLPALSASQRRGAQGDEHKRRGARGGRARGGSARGGRARGGGGGARGGRARGGGGGARGGRARGGRAARGRGGARRPARRGRGRGTRALPSIQTSFDDSPGMMANLYAGLE